MIKEHCGVVAVKGEDSIRLAYESLKLLQHRGQESAGIAFIENGKVVLKKGLGLVEEALSPNILKIKSFASIGHVRYSTTGSGSMEEAQPYGNEDLALAFNGTITNYFIIDKFAKIDTEFIFNFIKNNNNIIEKLINFSKIADGSYSMVLLTKEGQIIGFRDPRGFRPLAIGFVDNNIIISSEDSVIRQLGGKDVRDIKPGEIVIINNNYDITSIKIPKKQLISTCAFEYIYFARPDTVIDGISVYKARVRIGEILAENHPAPADIVIPVPESGIPFAIGYSRKSGLPLEEGIVRTLTSKRSFIMPNNDKRKSIIDEKFGVVRSVVEGKRIVLIDDSMVRGNTLKTIITNLRNNGAVEIHVRIGSPMIRYPCFMGIDFPTRNELIAYNRNEKEIARLIGADSVEYITLKELIEGIGRSDLCLACFSGNYPLNNKYDLEVLEKVFGRW
jgi:amidophosphoribosyltransferase